MVDTFLKAGDVLRSLLEAHQNGSIADDAPSIEICAKLEQLANNPNGTRAPNKAGMGQTAAVAGVPPGDAQLTYHIQFANTRAAFPSEIHLNNLLTELSDIGDINSRDITADKVILSLTSSAPEQKLREIFAFFP